MRQRELRVIAGPTNSTTGIVNYYWENPVRQREPRMHDPVFLRRLRQLPCLVPNCDRVSEAAHIRMTKAGIPESGSAKPHDCYAVPLCAFHHRLNHDAEHRVGALMFWRRLKLDPHLLAIRLYHIHREHDDEWRAVEAMRFLVFEERFASA